MYFLREHRRKIININFKYKLLIKIFIFIKFQFFIKFKTRIKSIFHT